GHGIGGPNSGTLDASASGNTVEYSNLNSSIYPASPGYYNLKISGSTNYPAMVSNIQVLGDFTIASGGMTSSTYTMSLKGNWYNYGTAATNAGQPKMNFNGTGTQTIYKSSTPEYFNNFKLSGTSTVSPPSGGLEVNDLLINSGATFDMGSASLFEVFGNWTNYGTFYPRTSITYLCPYSGNTDTLYNAAGVENFYNFGKVNPGTTVLRSNVKISGGSSVLGVWGLYIGSGGGGYGTLDAGGGADTIFLAGNWDNTGGTFTARNGAVIFNASSGTQTISKASGATEYFNNLTVAGGGTALLAGPICALGDLTLTSGYLDVSTSNYLLSVGGNWTNTSGAFVPRSGSVDFVQQSGATKTVSKTGGMETFYNLNKSVAGTLKLGSNIQVTGSLSLNNGTLDGNTGSYTLYLTKDWDNTNTGGSFVCG
ncbi:MAG TPA: hypothetical protein VNZ86_10720, partial [Bacteroidia bacterium]|nr:hypothetical protein [Bacteroidia bacterium]